MTSAGSTTRRAFLKSAGALVAALPLVQLAGCADDAATQPEPTADTPRGTRSVAPEGAPSAMPPRSAAGSDAPLPRLQESDAMAQGLGYRHQAAEVDAVRFPRFRPGQACENCSLYRPDASQEAGWGGCAIFPGRLVDARGWCNAYVPVV